MSDFIKFIQNANALPWDTIFLGGLLTTTSLTSLNSWRMARYMTAANVKKEFPEIGPNLEDITHAIPEEMDPRPVSKFEWKFDGASRTGKVRSENQDAFVVWTESTNTGFIAVCDGAGGIDGGKEAAQSAIECCLAVMKETAGGNLHPSERLSLAIDKAREVAKSNQLPGITTAILAHVQDDELTYATLGDGALTAIWPDGMISQILAPHHFIDQPDNIIGAYIGNGCSITPRSGVIRLETDMTLMLMSDGASDLFPYEDYARNHQAFSKHLAGKSNEKLADHFLKQIEEARDPESNAYLHHDNMTLVLAVLSEPITPNPILGGVDDQIL